MNLRFRFFLVIIVILTAGNILVSAQSGKTVTTKVETDSQNGTVSKTGNQRILLKCPSPENTIADSGIVVVIVRINKNGRIIKAQIDKMKSTTSNKMLFNNALKAAAYAKYNRIDKDTIETGQLTYKFKLN
jgi:hypothetical protein